MPGRKSGTAFPTAVDPCGRELWLPVTSQVGFCMTEAAVELRNVTLSYGNFTAVKDVSLSIAKGTFVTLLGPSGCGKTTILRSLAGLVAPTSGDIHIAGRKVNDVPIHKRNIGLVFQNYALFPHKTIFDNLAFGLKYRDVAKAQIASRVSQVLDIVRLPGVEKKVPSELSGGQQQRIALARAIVIEPDVLLLDEPLSALDANLREEMRAEIKNIQREVGITTIFVTHDQEEALAMSDRIVVMNHGVVEQSGTPEDVYNAPASLFVASFLGQSNLVGGVVRSVAKGDAMIDLDEGQNAVVEAPKGVASGDKVTLVLRAQKIQVEGPAKSKKSNHIEGKVLSTSYLGSTVSYIISAGKLRLNAITPISGQIFREGDPVSARFSGSDCVMMNAEGRRFA